MATGATCAGRRSVLASSRVLSSSRTSSCARSSWARATVAPRSPTPPAGGSTPSEPALRAGQASPGHQHLDNCIDIVIGVAPRDSEMGRSRHGAQLPVEQPSFDTGGSIPPTARHATGRAPTLNRDGFEPRAAVVAQLVRAPARHAGGCGFESRRRRSPCRRGRMEKVPVYETGGCRFDPCRRHQSRRSSAEQSAAFRTRRSHVRIVPARTRKSDAR